ncbi:hypothetical protein CaCOL14_008243 [Colletotrichum acutatum]
MMEGCFRRKINRDIEQGTAANQMRSYLVMLLRLRQASTHPFLLEGMMAEYFTSNDFQSIKEKLKNLENGNTVYNQIGSWTQRQRIGDRSLIEEPSLLNNPQLLNGTEELLDIHSTQTDESVHVKATNQGHSQLNGGEGAVEIVDDTDEVDSQDEIEEDEDGLVPERYLSQRTQPGHAAGMDVNTEDSQLQPFGQSDFGLAFDMSKQIQYLEKVLEIKRSKCVSCHQISPSNSVKGSKCGCVFCSNCVVVHLASKGRKCPRCRRFIGYPNPLKPFDNEEGGNAGSTTQTLTDKEYAKGFDYTGFQHTEDDKDDKHAVRFLQVADRHPHLPLTPSAKLTALKETVLRWQAEAPDDKIIIFSQFNVVMKLIGRLLEAEGIDFAYLSGKQNTEQRNRAVDEFQNGDKIKVLIVSLRAGGQCLNLTKANRVILMELWWNQAVEQQAFARVYRIGQIKETHFVRFSVDTPIEQRMLQMQASKMTRSERQRSAWRTLALFSAKSPSETESFTASQPTMMITTMITTMMMTAVMIAVRVAVKKRVILRDSLSPMTRRKLWIRFLTSRKRSEALQPKISAYLDRNQSLELPPGKRRDMMQAASRFLFFFFYDTRF